MPRALKHFQSLAPYAPGLSIAEIQEKYQLPQVVKMASNENPLGASPLVREAIMRHADSAFRYPQGGNPRLVKAISALHDIDPAKIAVSNGSDETIDLLIRMLARSGEHNVVCFDPCFNLYPIQADISGVETRRAPLRSDFSHDFDALLDLADKDTRLIFITTPDNPSGYCPPVEEVRDFLKKAAVKAPDALIVIDEAYMDFADEKKFSLLANHEFAPNAAWLRTFSKSRGLAGLRIGYAVLPNDLAEIFWRSRLPFSVNILGEEAALAALRDDAFYLATLRAVREGRENLTEGLKKSGCTVWPSHANFLLFSLPAGYPAQAYFEYMLKQGIIIRGLKSYGLPDHLRVSVGSSRENRLFLKATARFLESG